MQNECRFQNSLLSRLSAGDLDLLRPHLVHHELALRRRLSEADRTIEQVYFPESGIASAVIQIRHEIPIEIGLIGREGIVNVAVLMGADSSPVQAFMQIAGTGLAIDAGPVREAMAQSPSLQRTFLLFAHVYMVQIASTVLANSRASVTERLARWLLMAHDRVDGDELNLTHEFLAVMLGVRRAGVTVALQDLQRRGLISGGRGVVSVVEREGLEVAANGFYGSAEAEFRRIFSGPYDA